jgi:hypothetical protein
MSTTYYELASMAEASYVLFDPNKINDEEYTKAALQPPAPNESNLRGEFSATQAADFVANWSVIAHTPNDPDSDYSSTLFKSKSASDTEYVLAFRGTERLDPTDIIADGDIVTDGLAIWQIVSMYNDIQQDLVAA